MKGGEWKTDIAKALSKISGEGEKEALSSLCAPKGGQADFCSTLAFLVARKKRQNAAKIAAAWAGGKWPAIIEKAEAAGPYLNFHFSNEFWEGVLSPRRKTGGGKRAGAKCARRVIVEFPSVNPNKPWHAGHLRNAILGDSVANVLQASGCEVQRIDYIDDLGLQVAQSYWGSKNMEPGPAPEGSEEFAKKADHACGWQYVRVAREFGKEEVARQVRNVLKKMEEGRNETAAGAREFTQKIVKAQYETAFMLGIFHDALVFESDIMERVFPEGIAKIKKSGALQYKKDGKNAGCWVIPLEGAAGFEGLENADKVLIRSDGTATYTGKDVAFQMWKFGLLKGDFGYCEFLRQPNGKIALKTCLDGKKADFGKADAAVNVIGVEQAYPQKAIAAVLEKMGYEKEAKNSVHLAYEHVVLPEGKFSGRAGTWMKSKGAEIGFSADELIAEVVRRARGKINAGYTEKEKRKIARSVGVAALRFSFLRSSPSIKIVFDLERALSLSGDSGPYVQYSYARAANIVKKAGEEARADFSKYEFREKEIALLRLMLSWEGVLASCAANYNVHPACEFALEMAGALNSFYAAVPVLSEKDGNARACRLRILRGFMECMEQVMGVLGIEPLGRM